MDRERVKTVGASLIERKEGPYCLHVAEIKVASTFVLKLIVECEYAWISGTVDEVYARRCKAVYG